MQIEKKFLAIALALVLFASIAASTMLVQPTTAHTPSWNIPTFAYIQISPNPVGVGQQVNVVFWLDKVFDPSTALTNTWRFHNYKLTITDPDGVVTTKTFDYISDPTSSQYTTFTPDKVGTYTFNFTFPGQDYNTYDHNPNSQLVNDTYLPSSASTTLTVTTEQLAAPIYSYPLPSEYWTRPIYGENNDWWSVSSNWLGMGAPGYAGFDAPLANQQVNPGDAIGPLTSHIMWTKPLQSGGVVGGNNFAIQGDTYFEGSAYNQRYANPIILNGKIYYTEPISFINAPNSGFFNPGPFGPTDCVDLQTGQLIWSRSDVPPLSFGYVYSLQDPNQHGVYPAILFTSNFARAFDADTGDALFNVTNVPSGTQVFGPQGEILRYVISSGTPGNPAYYLAEWNSSKLWDYTGNWPVATGTIDGGTSNRYDWNISLPWATSSLTVTNAFYNNMLICYSGTLPSYSAFMGMVSTSSSPYTYYGVNLNASKGAVGTALWQNTIQPPAGNVTVLAGGADPTTGVFVEAYKETMQWVGYSMATGKQVWGPTASQTAFDYYGNTGISYVQGVIAYGKLYSCQYGGILYCYDLTNGNLLWTYGTGGEGNSTFSGFYSAYNHYPTFIAAVGNGAIYLITSEHTATNPIYKGALARTVNATDGSEIWTLSDYTSYLAGPFSSPGSYAIADGYATFFNGYDNQIYSVGRGPSATTVQAPQTQITAGEKVVIQGTVMDIAAGTKQTQQAADFPNGVPVSSDASMKDWMGYVYQQKPAPTNFTGVQVTLMALDPNNNYITLGSATTDENGLYHFTWTTPNVPGDYTVYAVFNGNNGYWGSKAETNMVVAESPQATVTPTTPQSSIADTYFIPAIAGLFVLVIIVLVMLAVMMMRKKA